MCQYCVFSFLQPQTGLRILMNAALIPVVPNNETCHALTSLSMTKCHFCLFMSYVFIATALSISVWQLIFEPLF